MNYNIYSELKNYSTIIWDWNGTLLNDVQCVLNAEEKQFHKYNITPPDPETRKKIFGHPISDYYKKVGFDLEKHSFKELSLEFFQLYTNEAMENDYLFKGTRDFLKMLIENKHNLFILSAAPEKHLIEITDKLKVSNFFTARYGLNNNQAKTKIPRAIELVNDYKIDPNKTIFIGDTDHDFETAEAIKCDCLLISQGHQNYERLKKLPTKVLETRY